MIYAIVLTSVAVLIAAALIYVAVVAAIEIVDSRKADDAEDVVFHPEDLAFLIREKFIANHTDIPADQWK